MIRAVLLAAALLAGCASVPATYLDPSMARATAETHVVTIECHSPFPGGAPLVVWVDGVAVAHVPGGQSINLYLADGRHIVGVGMPSRTGDKAPERTIAIDVSATSSPILRASVVAGGYGGWKIKQVN